MNPFPLVRAMLQRDWGTSLIFVLLIALSVGVAGAITAQERALIDGSARAAEKFDLVVAAPGSQTDLLLKVVFLDPGSVELLQGEPLKRLLSEPRAEFVAPIGFGDSYEGDPVVGTIPVLVDHLADGGPEGRVFDSIGEAVVGAASPLAVGNSFQVTHGHGEEAFLGDHHAQTLTVVGKLPPLGSPWDRAVLVPIEFVWEVHGLPDGHAAPPAGTDHDHAGERIGPPFDLERVPGIPAAIVKPRSFAEAYGLRNEWRTTETTAFFPAEVLVDLYELLGDMRQVMSWLAIGTDALLVAAVLAGMLILMRLYRGRFAILRALGASRFYVFAVAWTFGFALIATGAVAGLGVALILTEIVSRIFEASTGMALDAYVGVTELQLVGAVALLGAALAVVPALLVYRQPVIGALRDL